jgi:hypothetical protein
MQQDLVHEAPSAEFSVSIRLSLDPMTSAGRVGVVEPAQLVET